MRDWIPIHKVVVSLVIGHVDAVNNLDRMNEKPQMGSHILYHSMLGCFGIKVKNAARRFPFGKTIKCVLDSIENSTPFKSLY